MKTKKTRQKPLFKGTFIKELDAAAAYHEECKGEFVTAANAKTNAQAALRDAMTKHKLTSYESADGILVSVSESFKVTTKRRNTDK